MEKLSIEAIKSHTDIYDIVSQVVRLKKVGSKYVGLCPFHNEKTPSFNVSPSRQSYKCFGCGKSGDVFNFIQEVKGITFPEAIKSLSNIDTDTWRVSDAYKNPLPPSVKEPTYMNPKTVHQTMQGYGQNNFICFLLSILKDKAVVKDLIERFLIGTAKQGKTIFWQRDIWGYVRSGKIIQYSNKSGKRDKSVQIVWAHTALKLVDFNLSQCFFGESQLSSCSNKPVAIVESEKTAVIMTPIEPRYTWLACGGADGLTEAKCKILTDRNIILYPDLGKFDDWVKRANEYKQTFNLNIRVSDMLEKYVSSLPEDVRKKHYKKGYDIADYALQFDWYGELKSKKLSPQEKEQIILNNMIKQQPLVALFIRSFSLVNASLQPFYLPENKSKQ